MPALTPEIHKFLLVLAPHAASSAHLCRAIADGKFSGRMRLSDICLACGISSARSGDVEMVLDAGVRVGLLSKVGGMEWQPLAPLIQFECLSIALQGIATYVKQIHIDETEVEVVLTPPEKPSVLQSALLSRGYVGSMVDHTDAIFTHIASRADKRFIVMMPFIDDTGMINLMRAWESTKAGVKCILIIRPPKPDQLPSVANNLAKLNAMGIKVFNYWLEKGARYETFHAKILLADRNIAYVGSANATKASLELSMELGVTLTGKAANTVSEIVEAILDVALPFNGIET